MVRPCDRIEALAVFAVVAVGLLAVPVTGHIGDRLYEARMLTAEQEALTRHSVEAVVTEGSTGLPADFDTAGYVRVQWTEGARVRSERIISPGTIEEGATLTVWLDQSGKVVGAPMSAIDAKVSAVGASSTIWVTVVALVGLAALAVRRVLDRVRARAWERELLVLAHNDDGWANRSP